MFLNLEFVNVSLIFYYIYQEFVCKIISVVRFYLISNSFYLNIYDILQILFYIVVVLVGFLLIVISCVIVCLISNFIKDKSKCYALNSFIKSIYSDINNFIYRIINSNYVFNLEFNIIYYTKLLLQQIFEKLKGVIILIFFFLQAIFSTFYLSHVCYYLFRNCFCILPCYILKNCFINRILLFCYKRIYYSIVQKCSYIVFFLNFNLLEKYFYWLLKNILIFIFFLYFKCYLFSFTSIQFSTQLLNNEFLYIYIKNILLIVIKSFIFYLNRILEFFYWENCYILSNKIIWKVFVISCLFSSGFIFKQIFKLFFWVWKKKINILFYKFFFLRFLTFFLPFVSLTLLNFLIRSYLNCFFFIPFFFLRVVVVIILCWFLLMWIRRTFVISYKTSFLMYNYKENRKKIIQPLQTVIDFFIQVYWKSVVLICTFFHSTNMKIFLIPRSHNIFNFFLWCDISILLYIIGMIFASFLRMSYRKRVGLYIFNYRRIVVYCHWWGKKILGFARKQVLFRWINIFLCCIQYWRYANLEKRRLFRNCYRYSISNFIEMALCYYFKRYILKMTRSVYYCFSKGNYILKKVKFFSNIFCNYIFLKYSFIHLRYRRILLLIFIWNYSFLKFFIKYPLKLQLITHESLVNFKRRGLYSCKINHYF